MSARRSKGSARLPLDSLLQREGQLHPPRLLLHLPQSTLMTRHLHCLLPHNRHSSLDTVHAFLFIFLYSQLSLFGRFHLSLSSFYPNPHLIPSYVFPVKYLDSLLPFPPFTIPRPCRFSLLLVFLSSSFYRIKQEHSLTLSPPLRLCYFIYLLFIPSLFDLKGRDRRLHEY